MARRLPVLLALVVAGAGFSLCLYLTRVTPSVGVDGVVYLATASNVRDGRGVTTPFTFVANAYTPRRAATFNGAVPLTHFGPLYPVAIAGVGTLGLTTIDAARWLGCVTFALDLILFGFLVKRATAVRDWFLPSIAMILFVVGPVPTYEFGIGFGLPASWLALSGSVFAESMFLGFCLLCLLALARWLDEPRGRWLGLAASAAAAATLTRYAGVALIVCAGIAALVWGTGGARRRARDAALLVGGGILPSVLWAMATTIQGGESARAIVYHRPGRNVAQLLSNGSAWFFPSSIPETTRQVLFVILVAVFAAMAVDLVRLNARDSGSSLRRVLALFAVCYLAIIEITRFFLDVATPIDGRLMGPLQPVLYALMLGILVRWLHARMRLSRARAGALAGALAAVVALGGISSMVSTVKAGFVPLPKEAAAGRQVAALPAKTILVTNDPLALWGSGGRDSLLQPQRIIYTTGRVNGAYTKELRDTLLFMREQRGLYVHTPTLGYGSAQPSDYRAAGMCLHLSRALPNGWSLWKPAPCDSSAGQGAPTLANP
jgi:hypothetical protein